jgi:hypothetical protein
VGQRRLGIGRTCGREEWGSVMRKPDFAAGAPIGRPAVSTATTVGMPESRQVSPERLVSAIRR